MRKGGGRRERYQNHALPTLTTGFIFAVGWTGGRMGGLWWVL